MGTLHLVKPIGNSEFYRSDITQIDVKFLNGKSDVIPRYDVGRLFDDNYSRNVDQITVHTNSDPEPIELKLSQWLITEAD